MVSIGGMLTLGPIKQPYVEMFCKESSVCLEHRQVQGCVSLGKPFDLSVFHKME